MSSLLATELDGITPSLGLFLVALTSNSFPTKTLDFLIDTGSSLSILPSTFQPYAGSNIYRLRAANGSHVNTLGSLNVIFSIPNFKNTFNWNFCIADVTHPILGADFLFANSIIVDCRSRTLSTQQKTLSITSITPPIFKSIVPPFIEQILAKSQFLVSNKSLLNLLSSF